ncbi:MAG TPA: GNAT family N-acetyltransferase [Aliiroseovarius sp.]|nr:GNAT family N-acetyltransferase [Aliiroseovarius sp.]
MSVTIAETTDLPTCLALRQLVFVAEQGVPIEEEADAYDPIATHFLALDGAAPVGTARVVYLQDVAKIGRVCVLPSQRGTGLGAALIRAALAHAKARGTPLARLGAQVQAIGFYENLGFKVVSGEYDDAGIPHVDMERAP